MRVSFLLPPVNLSGGIRVVTIYARWLANNGHKVVLISPPERPPSLRERTSALFKGNGWLKLPRPQASHLDGSGLNHRVLNCYRPPNDHDVPDGDVLVATWWETAEWASLLSGSKGAKVYFVQGHEVFPYLPVERVRATYCLPMHKITVARWLKNLMQTTYGDPACDVVPNSVDKAQFYAPTRTKQAVPTVGFLYSEMPLKGLDISLEVVARLRQIMPNLRALCFGSHAPSRNSKSMAEAEFHHSPPQHAIRNLYAQCDVWLSTSQSEGFNLTAMEAMACRTPVVSTRTGWPEEAISDGFNGKLVDIDDPDGLVQGALEILSLSESDWLACSNNALATVAESSWEKSSRLFEAALLHACRRSGLGEIAGKCSLSGLKGCP